jgi:acyl-CoA thioesterase I
VSDRRLLFFGDSLIAGVGDPTGRGWVGRVVAASFENGLPLTGYNLGVRRETSEQVAGRWHDEALPRMLPEADASMRLRRVRDRGRGAGDRTVPRASNVATLAHTWRTSRRETAGKLG